MKKTFALILSGIVILATRAQVPQGIPYQAVARNLQGQPLANKNIAVRFSVLDSIATGPAVYSETHLSTTSNLGLFNLNVGMGTAVAGTFSSINWGVNSKFLKVELDTTALGTNYMDLGTQQMMSVPYALYSKSSEFNSIKLPNNANYGPLQLYNCGGSVSLSPCIPSVSTKPISNITGYSSIAGGEVLNDGGSAVLELGVVFDTLPNPSLGHSVKTVGPLLNTFEIFIRSLLPNKIYFIRSFATNSVGTGYGKEIQFTTNSLAADYYLFLGMNIDGGILTYLLQPNDFGYQINSPHGLITYTNTYFGSFGGNSNSSLAGALFSDYGTGSTNTDLVYNYETQAGSGGAIKYCHDLVGNGYSDWFLPSKDELDKIFINRNYIPGFVSGTQFGNGYYWSSTEIHSNGAWAQLFTSGYQTAYYKPSPISVLPVRYF